MNAVVAAIIAAVVAAVTVAIVRRRRLARGHERSGCGVFAATFGIAWLALMAYGCVEMFRPHHYKLDPAKGLLKVPGGLASTEDVLQAEEVAHGDQAQTYVLVRTTSDEVQHAATLLKLKGAAFDAHTAAARGWIVPEWWPNKVCPGGVTYNDDPFAEPPTFSEYVINWCPTEGRAYIQHFDY
jgi:hypothetical protein